MRDTDTTLSSGLSQMLLLNEPIDKSKSSTRWIVLVLACLMLVGSYYCFDIPAALKTQLDDWMGDPGDYEFKFGLLYTLYAAPNVILPVRSHCRLSSRHSSRIINYIVRVSGYDIAGI